MIHGAALLWYDYSFAIVMKYWECSHPAACTQMEPVQDAVSRMSPGDFGMVASPYFEFLYNPCFDNNMPGKVVALCVAIPGQSRECLLQHHPNWFLFHASTSDKTVLQPCSRHVTLSLTKLPIMYHVLMASSFRSGCGHRHLHCRELAVSNGGQHHIFCQSCCAHCCSCCPFCLFKNLHKISAVSAQH